MNFIPKELRTFLDDFKKTNRKILNASHGISDLNFNGETNHIFEIDFKHINISEEYSFLIVINELYISFQDPQGVFSISLLTKDRNNMVADHGHFYTGRFDSSQFRSINRIATSVKISKPVTLLLKINTSKQVNSIFNVGVTIN